MIVYVYFMLSCSFAFLHSPLMNFNTLYKAVNKVFSYALSRSKFIQPEKKIVHCLNAVTVFTQHYIQLMLF